MRLGLLGGSFDPVHWGHLQIARCSQQQAELDQVWFLPTATQPFKRHGPVATNEQRLAMLQLAVDRLEAPPAVANDEPIWKVSRLEIDRGGVSYTVDTLRHLHKELPAAELYFMMGADSLHDLPTWREPAALCTLATPLVVARAGEPDPNFDVLQAVCSPERVAQIRAAQVTMPATPIASSKIREAISRGNDVSDLMPRAVQEYIEQHQIYCTTRQTEC